MARRINTGKITSERIVGNLDIRRDVISSVTANGDITLSPDGTGRVVSTASIALNNAQAVRFQDTGSNHIDFKAPATVTANYTITLPPGVGALGQSLTTDASGNLSWGTPAGSVAVADNTLDAATHFPTLTTATSDTVITGLRRSSTKFTFQPSTGTLTSVLLNITGTTASTNSTTGSVTVGGGLGVAGAIFAGGAISSGGVVSDSQGNLRTVPLNSQGANYTLTAADTGKFIRISSGNITVPANTFSIGQVVSIFNNATNNRTVVQGASTTLYQAGTTNTGNRTLLARAFSTVLCVDTNTFVISGSGVT